MKDFKDVSPVEKKRESKARKGEKLEEEAGERRKRKSKVKEELPSIEEKPVETTEPVIKAAPEEVKTAKPAEAKKKTGARKPKPIEKIQYSAKKEVPELKLRKKKPNFRRQEHYKTRLKPVWRTARGIDSKQHEGKRGKGKAPSIGYKKPAIIQGIHPLGYRPVLIHNVPELRALDAKMEGAIIASAVGRRKRNEIIQEANKLKIIILNPRKGET